MGDSKGTVTKSDGICDSQVGFDRPVKDCIEHWQSILNTRPCSGGLWQMMMDTYGSPSVAVHRTGLNGARPIPVWSMHGLGAGSCLVQSKKLAPESRSHPTRVSLTEMSCFVRLSSRIIFKEGTFCSLFPRILCLSSVAIEDVVLRKEWDTKREIKENELRRGDQKV